MSQQKTLAIFDFDGTLLPGDSAVSLVHYAFFHGKCTLKEYFISFLAGLGYVTKKLEPNHVKSLSMQYLKRMTPPEVDAFMDGFVQKKLLPRLFRQGVAQVKRHVANGDTLLLVSASSEIYMKHVLKYLPFDAMLATPTTYQGTVSGNCRGEEKVRRVKAWLQEQGIEADWAASAAYGNSAHDIPVMTLTAHPVKIHPRKQMNRDAPAWPSEYWR